MEASWSIGVLVGLPVTILFVLTSCAAIIVGRHWMNNEYDDGVIVFWLGTVGLVITLGIAAVGFYPYSAEYHQWQPTDGTVATVDKRLIGSGDGMEEKFVVVFEGSGQQYGCDDTRCAAVKPGDHLALTCKRAWQFTGTDGYDCRFVSTKAQS